MTLGDSRRGQVAVGTGGSQGIGFAVASTLLAGGMSVAILARDRVKLDDAVARLERVGAGRVIGIPSDVADEAWWRARLPRSYRGLGASTCS